MKLIDDLELVWDETPKGYCGDGGHARVRIVGKNTRVAGCHLHLRAWVFRL